MNAVVRQTSTLAIISLVSGVLGWTIAPLLGSLGAIVFGHLARGEIRRQPDRLEGDGLAIAGLVLGWLQIVLLMFLFVAVVLFFGGLAAIITYLAALAPPGVGV